MPVPYKTCALTIGVAQVDLAVIETGLGGVRDATNVFTAKELEVAIFTTIDLEHSAALGAGPPVRIACDVLSPVSRCFMAI